MKNIELFDPGMLTGEGNSTAGTPTTSGDWWDPGKVKKGSKSVGTAFSCHKGHKALELGGGTLYGGSCIHPHITDADIYIGFDHGMTISARRFPWEHGDEVYFPIDNYAPPKSPEQFKKLVEWSVEQLEAGKKIHAGCMAGHGRTGLYLAAVYRLVTGEEAAIQKIREIYCSKAVESASQIQFLVNVFGIKTAAARMTDVYKGKKGGHVNYWDGSKAPTKTGVIKSVPVRSSLNIWEARGSRV